MRKMIFSFAAGVACTSLAFLLFHRSSPPLAEQVFPTPPPVSLASDPDSESSPAGRTSAAADAALVALPSEGDAGNAGLPEDLTQFSMRDDWSEEERLDLLRAWSDEELQAVEQRAQALARRSQTMLEAERVANLVAGELHRRERIVEWANAPPPDLPIELPPEFSRHLESATVLNMHERFQREPVEPTWSPSMEANIRAFFAYRPEITAKYGAPTINCRTSGCEMAFVSYAIDAAALAAEQGLPNAFPWVLVLADFMAATEEFREQPWADQFQNAVSPSIRTREGVTTVIWHLHRQPRVDSSARRVR